uniref:Uncharacterized protein n=1 Tax=Setaria italica TaxID=4555 RepID=K3ZY97_SETIT
MERRWRAERTRKGHRASGYGLGLRTHVGSRSSPGCGVATRLTGVPAGQPVVHGVAAERRRGVALAKELIARWPDRAWTMAARRRMRGQRSGTGSRRSPGGLKATAVVRW